MVTSEVKYSQDGDFIDWTPTAAIAAGEMIQLPDGRAAFSPSGIPAGEKGAVRVRGLAEVLKTASIVMLPGGRVYWDYSANKAHYKKVNDRDFYAGRVQVQAASTDVRVKIALNVDPPYDIDALSDGFLSVPTGTQAVGGFGYPKDLGKSKLLELTATNEAQCVDIFSVDRFAVNANAIVEGIIRIPVNGSGGAVDFNIGAASGTSTTDADAIAESVFFHIDGGSLDILAESDDATTEVNATDTTVDATAGSAVANRFEFWIDMRDPSDCRLYINGAEVLNATANLGNIALATGPLGLLAHLEKTSGTTTAQFIIDALRARFMEE